MHGRGKETGCDAHEQHGGDAHEPVDLQALGSLEKDAANDAGQDECSDDGQRQGAEILDIRDDAHQEDDGLEAFPQPGREGQDEEGVLPAKAHLVSGLRGAGRLERLLHLLLHLSLMRLLRVDHLIEVHSKEGQNNAGEAHHAELEDALIVALEELVGQGGEGQEAHSKKQADGEAKACAHVDLPPELVEQLLLEKPIILHLGQELHDDRKNDDHLQALAEEDDEGRHGEIDVGRLQPRSGHRDVVAKAGRLIDTVAHLDPLDMAVDLRALHVREARVASLILLVVAAPLADLARGVWHGLGQAEHCGKQERTSGGHTGHGRCGSFGGVRRRVFWKRVRRLSLKLKIVALSGRGCRDFNVIMGP